jgi:hypothetical protein
VGQRSSSVHCRSPSFVAVSYAGTSLRSGAVVEVALLVAAVGVACLGAYAWRDRIEERLRSVDGIGDASER